MITSIIRIKIFKKIIVSIASIFALYLVSLLFSSSFNNTLILPSPNEIIRSFFNLLGTPQTYLYILNTLLSLLISLVISFVIGSVLGIVAGLNENVRIFLKPWITIIRSFPLAAIIILILIIAGFKSTPYIVCSFILTPIIYEGISNAIANIDQHYIDSYKIESKTTLRIIRKVHIPLIQSNIKAVFSSSVGLGFKVLIMAEYLAGSSSSLGYAIKPAADNLNYPQVYAYCIIIVLLVLLIEYLPKLIIALTEKIKEKKTNN